MPIRAVATFLYWFVGVAALASGAVVALTPTGLLPASVEQLVIGIGGGDPLSMHLMQELGSALVFIGLITFWFIRHYEQSMPFHWALTAFLGLFGLAHIVDLQGTWHLGLDRLGDIAPFAMFAVVGVLRRSERMPNAGSGR